MAEAGRPGGVNLAGTRLGVMSEKNDSAVANFVKAIVLVALAILALKLLGTILGVVLSLVFTAIIVLILGVVIFGLVRLVKH